MPGKAGARVPRPAPPRLPGLRRSSAPGSGAAGSVLSRRPPGQPRCRCSRGASSSSRARSAGRCSLGKTKRDADAVETAPSIQAFYAWTNSLNIAKGCLD